MEKKRKMTKRQETTINSFYIYFLGKFIFCRKRIWNNLVYTVTFALQFFRVAGYWKCSNKAPTPIQICRGLADVVLRPEILGNILGLLTQILIVMSYYFFFIYFREVPSIQKKKQKHYNQKIKSILKGNIWFNP